MLPYYYYYYKEEGRVRSYQKFVWDKSIIDWRLDSERLLFFSEYQDISSIPKRKYQEEFKIFPNPVDEILFIQYPGKFSQSQLEIFDVRGKLVFSNVINGEMALTGIDSGIYTIIIKDFNNILFSAFFVKN